MCTIKVYETSRGDEPVYDFIENLDIKPRNKVNKGIKRLQDHGIQQITKDGKCEKFKGRKDVKSLYELIINYNGMWYRIFFTTINNSYWLLHAFKKKTNETPKKELDLAIFRYKELIIKLKK